MTRIAKIEPAKSPGMDSTLKNKHPSDGFSVLESLIDEEPRPNASSVVASCESPKMLRQLLSSSGADRNRIRNSSDLLSQTGNAPSPTNSAESSSSSSGSRLVYDLNQQLSSAKFEQIVSLLVELKEATESSGVSYQEVLRIVTSSLNASNDAKANYHVKNSRPQSTFEPRLNSRINSPSFNRGRSETVPNLRTSFIQPDADSAAQESLLAQLVIEAEEHSPHFTMNTSPDANLYTRKRSITHHLWPLNSPVKLEPETIAHTQLTIFQMLNEIQQLLWTVCESIPADLILAVVSDELGKFVNIDPRLLTFLQRVWPPLLVLHCMKNNFQFSFSPSLENFLDQRGEQIVEKLNPSVAFAQNLFDFIQQGFNMKLPLCVFDAICHLVITQVAYPDFCLVSYSVATGKLRDKICEHMDLHAADRIFTEILMLLNQLTFFDGERLRNFFLLRNKFQPPTENHLLKTFCQQLRAESQPPAYQSTAQLNQLLMHTLLAQKNAPIPAENAVRMNQSALFENFSGYQSQNMTPPTVAHSPSVNFAWPGTRDPDLRTPVQNGICEADLLNLLAQLTKTNTTEHVQLQLEQLLQGFAQNLNDGTQTTPLARVSFDVRSRKRKAELDEIISRQRSATFTHVPK